MIVTSFFKTFSRQARTTWKLLGPVFCFLFFVFCVLFFVFKFLHALRSMN